MQKFVFNPFPFFSPHCYSQPMLSLLKGLTLPLKQQVYGFAPFYVDFEQLAVFRAPL